MKPIRSISSALSRLFLLAPVALALFVPVFDSNDSDAEEPCSTYAYSQVSVIYRDPVGNPTAPKDDPMEFSGDSVTLTAEVTHISKDGPIKAEIKVSSGEMNRAAATKKLAQALRAKLENLSPGSGADVTSGGNVITVRNSRSTNGLGKPNAPRANPNVGNTVDSNKPGTVQFVAGDSCPLAYGPSLGLPPVGPYVNFRILCSEVHIDPTSGSIVPFGGPGTITVGQGVVDARHRVTLTYTYLSGSGNFLTESTQVLVEAGSDTRGLAESIKTALVTGGEISPADITTTDNPAESLTDEITCFESEYVYLTKVGVEINKGSDATPNWKPTNAHMKVWEWTAGGGNGTQIGNL